MSGYIVSAVKLFSGFLLLFRCSFVFASNYENYKFTIVNNSSLDITSIHVHSTHGSVTPDGHQHSFKVCSRDGTTGCKTYKEVGQGSGNYPYHISADKTLVMNLKSGDSDKDTSVQTHVVLTLKSASVKASLTLAKDFHSRSSSYKKGICQVNAPYTVDCTQDSSVHKMTITLMPQYLGSGLIPVGLGSMSITGCGNTATQGIFPSLWTNPCYGDKSSKPDFSVTFSGHPGSCTLTGNSGILQMGTCTENSGVSMKASGNNILFICTQDALGQSSCPWLEKNTDSVSSYMQNLYG